MVRSVLDQYQSLVALKSRIRSINLAFILKSTFSTRKNSIDEFNLTSGAKAKKKISSTYPRLLLFSSICFSDPGCDPDL